MIQKALLFFIVTLLHLVALAQQPDSVEMADAMRENGKIYVVVAVILTIFAGIIIYLIRLERKIARLEKEK